jgi:hypothetical protein
MIPLDKRSLQRLIEYLVRAHPHRLGVLALRLRRMHKRVLLVLAETRSVSVHVANIASMDPSFVRSGMIILRVEIGLRWILCLGLIL